MNPIQLLASGTVGVIGAWSALQYWRQGRKVAVILVLNLVIAIVTLLCWDQVTAQLRAPLNLMWKSSVRQDRVNWDTDQQSYLSATMLKQLQYRTEIVMQGDGLRASQWRDVPARHLTWQAPIGRDRIKLQAPIGVTLGREFELAVHRTQSSSVTAKKVWSAQLFAENGQLLAEQSSEGPQLTLRWLPPIAERMELQLKILDHDGRIIDSGPIPLEVTPLRPLQVIARFGSASFDISSLRQLLQVSEANLDWQTRMGLAVQHQLQTRDVMAQANLVLIDASYWESASAQIRQQILQKVAQGSSLLILGANARQAQIWRESIGLELRPGGANASNTATNQEIAFESMRASQRMEIKRLAMAATPMQAIPNIRWSTLRLPDFVKDGGAMIVGRDWDQGRIVWIGVSDWHRYAISAPETLKQWWQAVLDQSLIVKPSTNHLRVRETMPLVGERISLCLEAESEGDVAIKTLRDATQTTYSFVPSLDEVGQECVSWRAQEAGWQLFSLMPSGTRTSQAGSEGSSPALGDPSVSQQNVVHRWVYVYPSQAWPTWQRELKRDATLVYQNRLVGAATTAQVDIPRWPLLAWMVVLSLLLWFSDTRRIGKYD